MQYSLGKIVCVTPGQPQRLTVNESDPTLNLHAHAYLIRWDNNNSGRAYISLSPTDNRTSLSQIITILDSSTPSFNAGVTNEVNGIPLQLVYIDFDNSDDFVIASAIIS